MVDVGAITLTTGAGGVGIVIAGTIGVGVLHLTETMSVGVGAMRLGAAIVGGAERSEERRVGKEC